MVNVMIILVKMEQVLMMQLTMLVVLLKVVSVMAQMQVEVASVGAVRLWLLTGVERRRLGPLPQSRKKCCYRWNMLEVRFSI